MTKSLVYSLLLHLLFALGWLLMSAISPRVSVDVDTHQVLPARLSVLLKRSPQKVQATPAAVKADSVMLDGAIDGASISKAAPSLSVPVSQYYYPAIELSEGPLAERNFIPLDGFYLPSMLGGNVILRLYINETGGVDEVAVEETDAALQDLHLMLQGFRAMHFKAGVLNGVPVKSEYRIEVVIEPVPEPRLSPLPGSTR